VTSAADFLGFLNKQCIACTNMAFFSLAIASVLRGGSGKAVSGAISVGAFLPPPRFAVSEFLSMIAWSQITTSQQTAIFLFHKHVCGCAMMDRLNLKGILP
jgi:hypothetical protein